MAFLIKRLDQGGGYVAKPGMGTSYVHSLVNAKKYPNREAAQQNCCENESVVDLEYLIDQLRR